MPDLSCQQSGLCRARGAIGDSCDPFQSQCAANAVCDPSGVCVSLNADRAIGEPCNHHEQCQTNQCESGVCVGYCQGTTPQSAEPEEVEREERGDAEAEEPATEETSEEPSEEPPATEQPPAPTP